MGKDYQYLDIALPWFSRAFSYIDNLVTEFYAIAKNDKPALAQKLAEILDNVNYLHPFRGGNGRVQREFLRSLALEKGLILVLNPPDDETVFQRYMEGTIQGSVATLSSLILELILSEPGISHKK
ncbi:MAG: hypothetical protein GX801_01570 [Fibrobacter sp.]|nr:hypothetical protein [Fibrobacter sp.]